MKQISSNLSHGTRSKITPVPHTNMKQQSYPGKLLGQELDIGGHEEGTAYEIMETIEMIKSSNFQNHAKVFAEWDAT